MGALCGGGGGVDIIVCCLLQWEEGGMREVREVRLSKKEKSTKVTEKSVDFLLTDVLFF